MKKLTVCMLTAMLFALVLTGCGDNTEKDAVPSQTSAPAESSKMPMEDEAKNGVKDVTDGAADGVKDITDGVKDGINDMIGN